jgi:hypothetical protein
MNLTFDHTRKNLYEALQINEEQGEKLVTLLDEMSDMRLSQSEAVEIIFKSDLSDNAKVYCVCCLMRHWAKAIAERKLALICETDMDANRFEDVPCSNPEYH